VKPGQQVVTTGAYGLPDNAQIKNRTTPHQPKMSRGDHERLIYAPSHFFPAELKLMKGIGRNIGCPGSSPIIFLILTLAAAGAYLAFNIPVSSFSLDGFSRVGHWCGQRCHAD